MGIGPWKETIPRYLPIVLLDDGAAMTRYERTGHWKTHTRRLVSNPFYSIVATLLDYLVVVVIGDGDRTP